MRIEYKLERGDGIDLQPLPETDLPPADEPKTDEPQPPRDKPRVADLLVELACENTELFHDQDNSPCAVTEDGLVIAVDGPDFKQWLSRQWWGKRGKTVGANALGDAISCLCGKAMYDGEQCDVHVRVAATVDEIRIDLGDNPAQLVRITRDGWKVTSHKGAYFRRGAMRSLPYPVSGGDLRVLQSYLRVDERALALTIGFMLAALGPVSEYPLLVFHGEQGSGKSTASRIVARFVDPSQVTLRSPPRNEDDLLVATRWSLLLALDNVSKIDARMSDALARVSTGGGIGKRAHYTNASEIVFEALRPILLNGIPNAVEVRADLLDRAIVVELKPMPEANRRTGDQLMAGLEEHAGRVFGALLDALVAGLEHIDYMPETGWSRMASAERWIEACEHSGSIPWEPGVFRSAYREAAATARRELLENDVVATGVLRLPQTWSGRTCELRQVLYARLDDLDQRTFRETIRNDHAMAAHLRRIAPVLRTVGVDASQSGPRGRRAWTIKRSSSKSH